MERNGLRRRKRRIACHRWVMMSLESNSGAADARATVTWPSAEVSARLNPFRTALLCSRASTRESSNWVTASWHRVLQAERSWVSSPRADGSMPHCFRLTFRQFRASLYHKTGPHCRRYPTASCPRNTCFGILLSGMRIMWLTHRSCALSTLTVSLKKTEAMCQSYPPLTNACTQTRTDCG